MLSIFRGSKRGFSMVEVMIALAILGVAIAAFTQLMQGTFKGQRRVEDKAKQTDFANRLQNIIYDQSSCTAALLSGDPIVFDPKNMGAFNNDPVKPKIRLVLGDGTRYKEGEGIETLSLRIRNEVPPAGSGKYEGNLWVSAPGISTKSALKPNDIGLMLLTVPEGSVGLRKVTQCFTRNEVDGRRTCESLGGKWIASLNRCLFGSDLKLASNEWIDPAEFKSGGALEGAFVTKCYYRYGHTVTTYNCWNVSSNAIAHCIFEGESGSGGMWQVKIPGRTTPSYRCDNGVTISLPDTSYRFLADNEMTDKVYVGTAPTGSSERPITTGDLTKIKLLDNYDILPDVQQCFTDPNGTMTQNCNQGTNAIEGKVGSCLFVSGALGLGNTNVTGEALYQPNYTGWIWTTSARATSVVGSGVNKITKVQEASGRKCYMVQTAPSSTDKTVSGYVTDVKDPFDTSNTNLLLPNTGDRWKNVQECDFLGDTGGWDPFPVVSTSHYASTFKGRYLMRYACDQSLINDDNLAGSADPSLNAKSCWYFKDVPVAVDFNGNMGVTSAKRYTGWMYLRANLPGGSNFKTETATNYVTWNGLAVGGSINAVPCNVGVRITK